MKTLRVGYDHYWIARSPWTNDCQLQIKFWGINRKDSLLVTDFGKFGFQSMLQRLEYFWKKLKDFQFVFHHISGQLQGKFGFGKF